MTAETTKRVLIVGAQPGSLGDAVARAFINASEANSDAGFGLGWETCTAGVSTREDEYLDVFSALDLDRVLSDVRPHVIVCTVGVNFSTRQCGETGWRGDFSQQMMINAHGPLYLLEAALRMRDAQRTARETGTLEQFIPISSNSAHIARRNSAGYCASKAALSMALRCIARERGGYPLIYGYELGLLAGTPMTKATEAVFGPAQSRMVGAEGGLDPAQVAAHLVAVAQSPWQGLNGTLQRLDAGEQ